MVPPLWCSQIGTLTVELLMVRLHTAYLYRERTAEGPYRHSVDVLGGDHSELVVIERHSVVDHLHTARSHARDRMDGVSCRSIYVVGGKTIYSVGFGYSVIKQS